MIPEAVQTAVEALKEKDCVTVLEEPYQQDGSRRWILPIRLSPENIDSHPDVPPETDWYVHLRETYPAGDITIYPADKEEQTITATFPHQQPNEPGSDENPWREGNICVARYGHTLDQLGAVSEPTTASERISWHIDRALQWVENAAANELREAGEPFEIPPFTSSTGAEVTVAFNETTKSFGETWSRKYGTWGTATLTSLSEMEETYAAVEYRTESGESVYEPDWGDYVDSTSGETFRCAWLLVENRPFIPPWETPETWGDLDELLEDMPLDIYEIRGQIRGKLEEEVPDDQPLLLLIGFPIPEVVDGDSVIIHWQPLEIVSFEDPTDVPGGWRQNVRGQVLAERFRRTEKPILWMDGENWAHEQLTRRGHVHHWLLQQNVLIIGAGALGSCVAESLARGGCRNFTITDGESIEIGNLARHTLTLDDVGDKKATALAAHLRTVSPYVTATGIDTTFPVPDDQNEWVKDATVVIDCTASREVRQALADLCWDEPVLFCSAAMGRRANRLYVYTTYAHTFDHDTYTESYERWRLQENIEWNDDEDAIPERIGCWHPASVIRMDRVSVWAGIVTQLLDQAVESGLTKTDFTVLEMDNNDIPQVRQATQLFQNVATWSTPDKTVTVDVPVHCLEAMYDRYERDAPNETGGILAGKRFSDGHGLIVNAQDPPPDSIQEPDRFLRGTEKVEEWLRNARERIGINYFGEWHSHPSGSLHISRDDREAMNEIASSEEYDCPHPLLFIVGEDDTGDYDIHAYLFHRQGTYEELQLVSPPDSTVLGARGGDTE